ncbi:MAG: hypothetical protein AB7O44_27440 [Hyphomicrobiaceae bacterium]
MPDHKYGYRKTMTLTTMGLDLEWEHMPEADAERNLKVIRETHAELRRAYKGRAKLETSEYYARLTVTTIDPDNHNEVFVLEGIGCALLSATRWGGPG